MSEKQSINVDVLIVGGGPAGLACAISLQQIAQKENRALQVAVLEKAASCGDHIVSGAVLKTDALDELLPGWQQDLGNIVTPVEKDRLYWLTKKNAWPLPVPPGLNNQGCVVTSLSRVCRWLSQKAEDLGVMVLSGYAGQSLLMENDKVVGVKTGDMGLDKDGHKKPNYQEGTEIYAPVTVMAEGCRGSLSEQIIKKYQLRQMPQNYGMGLKEVWRIDPKKHDKGLVIHTLGWPLDSKTYGGVFCYHWSEDLFTFGLVVGLDYQNPYLNPYQELQRLKHHPLFKDTLEGATPIAYAARALNEGGYQALPNLNFPGGIFIGCSAGFLNVAQLKGTHYAMRSGMIAARHIMDGNVEQFNESIRNDERVGRSLYRVRNLRPAFYYGRVFGVIYSGISEYLIGGREPWTFTLREDHKQLRPAKYYQDIDYPKPDNKISYPLLAMLQKTGTNHEEDQPCHLVLKDKTISEQFNRLTYAFPEGRYCPANVYELVQDGDEFKLQINAANCIHCKTCDIKDFSQNISWQPPQGGEGPGYQIT